jgi:hypothetical protein
LPDPTEWQVPMLPELNPANTAVVDCEPDEGTDGGCGGQPAQRAAPEYPDKIDWDRIGNDRQKIVDHVKDHEQDDRTKDKHGFFDGSKTSKQWTEDAIGKAKKDKLPLVADRRDWAINVDMGVKTGKEGGRLGSGDDTTKIRLIFNDSGQFITAYPVK